MLTHVDIKIPSVTSQTSGIPLQDCGSHYGLAFLAKWPFLCFRSAVAFVTGDITVTKVGPFLLNSTFLHGVVDCFRMCEGHHEGPQSCLFRWETS